MSAQATSGEEFRSTTSGSTELIKTNGAALSSLTVYDYHRGAYFANKEEAKNVFYLWQLQ